MTKAKGKKKTEVLDYGAQVRSLREQGPGRLYLLWGREDYLREQYLLELKKICLPGGEDDFSYHRFDGAELDFQALADAVDAVPFLTERTLIEVRGFDTNKCREEEAQALVRVIGDLPDYCTLVFLMSTDFEPDGRLKTTKAFKKYGELIQFTAQGESALVRWVGKRFAAHKKHISPEDARQLIFFTGGLMNSMIPEIDKIAAYVSSDTVTRADILAVAHRLPEAVAYELTDRLADQDYDGAMRILADLLADKANTPIFLLAVIGQQMRRLYAARLARHAGLGTGDLRALRGLPCCLVRLAKHAADAELSAVIHAAAAADDVLAAHLRHGALGNIQRNLASLDLIKLLLHLRLLLTAPSGRAPAGTARRTQRAAATAPFCRSRP